MTDQTIKKNPRRFIIQLFALSLILVAFPLLSWYGLKRGYDYRLAILNDLNDHGVLNEYDISSFPNSNFKVSDLKGSVVIVTFIEQLNDDYSETIGKQLEKLVEQFGKTEKVRYLIHTNDQSNIDSFRGNFLDNNPYSTVVTIENETLIKLKKEQYKCGTAETDFIIIDSEMKIRNCYSNSTEDMKRLVEHVSVLTPRGSSEDPVVKRNTEK